MKLRFVILYVVFLLAPASSFCLNPHYSPAFSSFDDRFEVKQDDDEFIDNADLVDLLEDDILYIDEENSAGNNGGHRSGSRNGGKVFDPDNDLQCRVAWFYAGLSCYALPDSLSILPEGRTTPLFLLHRVFRI